MADRVVRRLEGVVIARGYSLLEYNIPRISLPEAEKLTPGSTRQRSARWKTRLVCGARDGPAGRSDSGDGETGGSRRFGHSRNADHQLSPLSLLRPYRNSSATGGTGVCGGFGFRELHRNQAESAPG